MTQVAIAQLSELKFDRSGQGTFSGYASVFNVMDSYGDVIVPGAFADTLAQARRSGNWPPMLFNHGYTGGVPDFTPIGVWTDIAEDGSGLWVEGKLADTERGREVYQLLKMEPRPALNGLSIGYNAKRWTAGTKPKEPRRKLEEVELVEISIVTLPANPKARVTAIKTSQPTIRDAEQALREAGFSRAEAKAILARGFRAVDPGRREADEDTLQALQRLSSILTAVRPMHHGNNV